MPAMTMWPDTNAIIAEYRAGASVKAVAKAHCHSVASVSALLSSLGLLRTKEETSRLAWRDPERRARQSALARQLHIEQRIHGAERTIPRHRTQSIHQLAVWFQYAKERLDRYPNGDQAAAIIEQLRKWNGRTEEVVG